MAVVGAGLFGNAHASIQTMNMNGGRKPSLAFSLSILPFILLLLGCTGRQPGTNFQLVETERSTILVTDTVSINNCENRLFRLVNYLPEGRGFLIVENLEPNGGEPFVSIKRRIWEMYGLSAGVVLVIPGRTNREFELVLETTKYRGVVNGPVVEMNKIVPHKQVTFYYPVVEHVVINRYQDIPCP